MTRQTGTADGTAGRMLGCGEGAAGPAPGTARERDRRIDGLAVQVMRLSAAREAAVTVSELRAGRALRRIVDEERLTPARGSRAMRGRPHRTGGGAPAARG